jgi:hypothetical protein
VSTVAGCWTWPKPSIKSPKMRSVEALERKTWRKVPDLLQPPQLCDFSNYSLIFSTDPKIDGCWFQWSVFEARAIICDLVIGPACRTLIWRGHSKIYGCSLFTDVCPMHGTVSMQIVAARKRASISAKTVQFLIELKIHAGRGSADRILWIRLAQLCRVNGGNWTQFGPRPSLIEYLRNLTQIGPWIGSSKSILLLHRFASKSIVTCQKGP